jgi:hypothetical protein
LWSCIGFAIPRNLQALVIPSSFARRTTEDKWDMPGHGGFLMVGEKGGIFHPGMRPDSPRLYPKQRWEEYRADKDQRVAKTIPRTKGLKWDAAKLEIGDNPEAAKLIKPQAREGWRPEDLA